MNIPQVIHANAMPLYQGLGDVIAEINRQHELAGLAVRRGLEHAKRAGELLIAAKAYLGHGRFLPWVEENCQFSCRTAQLYMRLAANWAELESKCATITHLTLNQAIHALTMDRSAEVHHGRADNLPLFAPSEAPAPLGAPTSRSAADNLIEASYQCPCCGHEWSGSPRPKPRKMRIAA